MTTIHDSHPSRDQLAALSEGRLTGEEVLAVESHVTTCEVCAVTLGELGAGDQLLARLRSAVVDDPNKTSMFSSNQQAEEEIRKFLEPSARAGALGRLGHYDVLEGLGRGAFGIVLKAFDDSLQRVVAVKVLAPEIAATSPARKRFLREARTAAQVRHQNVVQIYAVEEQPLPYLVMEYIPGETLQQRLNHCGPLEVPEVLRIGHEIARGLAAAHDQGLIHRDIKPGNILLEKGLEERVKLTDFGLARAVDDASLTQSGVIAGTPMFMAPEQARGETTDQRADLFSLGSVLYTMVSGRPPFRASGTVAVLKRVCDDAPRPIQEIIPETPQWLCDIISKLHAKRPEDRFASAREVADLLGQCLTELKQQKVPSVPSLAPQATPTAQPANGGRQPPGINVTNENVSGTALAAGFPSSPTTALAAGFTRSATPAASALPLKGSAIVPAPAGRMASVRNRGLVIPAAALLVLLSGLTLTEATGVTKFAATIIRIATGEGQIVIETDGAGVEVVIKDQQGTVLVDGATKREITFKAGEYNIEVTVTDAGGEQRFLTDQFTLTRNGKIVVDARWELAKAKPKAESTDPDRRAAAWVLAIDGTIKIILKETDEEREIKAGGELPQGALELKFVNLNDNKKVTDAGLARFKDCKNLAQLHLSATQVSDAGLAHFKDCKNLTHLGLYLTQVGDAGLAHFKDCKSLTWLHLGGTQVSDLVLAQLKDCKELAHVDLAGTQVSDMGLTHLNDCKNLAHVDLGGTKVRDAGLAHLKEYKSLAWLHLGSTQVSDMGLAHFKDCKNLRGLNLDGTQVTDAGLAHLKDCKNLTNLHLWNTQVSDAGLKHVAGLPKLVYVILKNTKVTEAGVKKFSAVLPECKIEWDGGVIEAMVASADPDRRAAEYVLSIGGRISIKENGQERPIEAIGDLPRGAFELTVAVFFNLLNVSDAGLAHFKNCKNLTELNLTGTQISDAGLAHFKNCKNLTVLNIASTQVSDAGLAHFKDCKNLTVLGLSGTQISDAGLAHFKNCKNLTQLVLSSPQVSDAGLAQFQNCKNLTQLLLHTPQVSDAGLAHVQNCENFTRLELYLPSLSDTGLAHFKDCKNLNELNLHYTQVSDAGLAHFQGCKNLTAISLASLQVSDAGLAHFQNCKNLTILSLSSPQVSDAGLAHFKDCKNLRQLFLNVTQVSDSGLAHFQDCTNLIDLGLHLTQVSDACLADLAGLPSLTGLDLRRTRISLRGHEELKAAMPKCQITWSEANRTLAESVLALGGTVEISPRDGQKTRPIQAAADLPGDYFQVRRVSLASVAIPLDKRPELLAQFSSLRFSEFDRLECLDLSGIIEWTYGFLAPIYGLQELSLANAGLLDSHLPDRLPTLPALKRLVLDGNSLGGPGLTSLEKQSALTELSLVKAGLNDESLANLPKLPALKRLALDGNEIRGTGLTHLSGQPELIDLSLNCPTLTDLFSKNLAELKQLKRLSLAGSGLTDVGIKHLAGLTNLESLDLRRTKATTAGIAELQKALPKCEIEGEGKKDK